MPTEDQITAQMDVIRRRLVDYARAFPHGAAGYTEDQLRAQAIFELTGNPPAIERPVMFDPVVRVDLEG